MITSRLLQRMVDASQDGIVIAEQEGEDNILIYVNKAFETLTGYSSDDILYQDCRFLQAGDRDQTGLQLIRDAIASGQPTRQILRNYRKDGAHFWNELSITPVFNENDQLTYFIGVQKDVTAQVKAQQRVAQLEAELAGVKAELQALKATNGVNKTQI
ncbi:MULTISPECIES: PAS domain-containing protein [Pseudomonas]|jgi:PAS domain S-box-containing protein|uniref:PAS domain-containing protein n=1 Tax=Pseudomonas TaxID=286 RepID=UPI00028A185B|nr:MULTISPECIES: PAS domain-containing protein [Pseudomonas]AMB80964.1 histidine kinase [Pseudomonas fragi]MCB1655557.1 PAS domain-containing protein [Pseudomonadales bacterium]NBF13780.1 PAS domain-containing protein [Pseudomonas sp. Fl4BN2]NNG60107.1 PAS domain-containing protein [Pseudomonas sp. GC01]MCH4870830.1 PAS domain-containing protein [Pseudomonas sp. TMW22089]